MPLRSRRWLPALPGHKPPRSITLGKATNPQHLGLRRRALIFGDSGSNNRATAATPKTVSQAEPPPFPHLRRCPPCIPHPRQVTLHQHGGRTIPRSPGLWGQTLPPSQGRGRPRGCPTTNTARGERRMWGCKGRKGPEPPGPGSGQGPVFPNRPTARAARLAVLPQDVTNRPCVWESSSPRHKHTHA